MRNFIEKLFKVKENNSSLKIEILAGVTTFLSMAYILAVNPAILSAAGMERGGVLIATALAAFFGTIFMALLANYPFALAPSMGLNAYFAYTVVKSMGYSYQVALFAVFIEGFIFLLLSLTSVREMIFNAIPLPLKKASGIGIGLFIAFIAFQNAHIIEGNDTTLVTFQKLVDDEFHTKGIAAILAISGILFTAWMITKKVKGAILFGILITWFLGIACELAGVYHISKEPGFASLIPDLSTGGISKAFSEFKNLFSSAFEYTQWSKTGAKESGFAMLFSMNFVTVILAFLFVDLFSAIGTFTGVASQAGLLDENGKLPKIKGAFMADSLATSIGAVFGTSTTTTYVESATGVVEGGKTGFTAITTAFLFLLSIFFAPLLLAVPSFATAPALVIVGFYMITPIRELDFSDIGEAIPAYLTIIVMPFAYSITDGISIGIITWTLLNALIGKWKRLSPLMLILTALFLANYFLLK
ncbi:MAG: NCS2 family permease [Lentisphaeria bacterium]|nr:NCS2 family permease [Lentisphaeria bacterium]MBR7118776.1 NCS2 family permease [Lentisphaeria bacterium]